jgi:hypothetical protein
MTTRSAIRKAAIVAMLGVATLVAAMSASAHPLGNNTVSRQARLAFSEHGVALRYRMDFAEIPTLAAADEADSDGDGATDAPEWRRFAREWSSKLAAGLRLEIDGQAVQWKAHAPTYRLGEGEAGLNVLLLEVVLDAQLPAGGTHRARYRDDFRARDLGWKEILLAGSKSLQVNGGIARNDRSNGLTTYPKDGALLQELSADFDFRWLPMPGNVTASAVPIATPAAPRKAAPVAPPAQPVAGDDPAAPAAAAESASTPGPVPIAQALDTASMPSPQESAKHPTTSLAAYFALGVHHIATGFDHLAFLLGLLLLSPRVRAAVKLVSAFTVAHSLTLILAAGHWVAPPGAWLEPAIAFTVAYVGFIAWRRRAAGHGVVLAFSFGLIHGFGFAGALAETLGDAAQGPGWLLKLLSFNLGIETLQVAIVVAALAIASQLRSAALRSAAHRTASLAVLACGLAWLAMRLIGPAAA